MTFKVKINLIKEKEMEEWDREQVVCAIIYFLIIVGVLYLAL
jgi:hypothetical protein